MLLLSFPNCTPGILPYATMLLFREDESGLVRHALGVVEAKSANHAINLFEALTRKGLPAEMPKLTVVSSQAYELCDPVSAKYVETQP